MEKHELIARIDAAISGIPTNEPVDVAGHSWGLHILDRFEEAESKTYVPSDAALLQALTDTSLQQLTLAVQSIDGVRVEDLFPAPATLADAAERRRVSRTAFQQWLGHLPGTVSTALWMAYLDLKDRSRKALEGLSGPLSKKAQS